MFDFSHLPQSTVINEYLFVRAEVTSIPTRPHVWAKPPNCRFVFMLLMGGGGGGSGGVAGAAGTSRSGGGGGGSGGISQALFLSSSIPSSLYVMPYSTVNPASGAGGASNTAGSPGVSIAIANYPSGGISAPSASVNFLVAAAGEGGLTNNAGNGGATVSATNCALVDHAIYYSFIGGRNGTWVANGLPGNTSIGTSSPRLGGSGGGGVLTGIPTAFNGAGFTSEIPAILPDIAGGLASSALNASSGVRLPFVSVGGAGGGANDNGPGGGGGNGVGYGAGGGGGGAGITGQGGRGGNGGPAYACIIAW